MLLPLLLSLSTPALAQDTSSSGHAGPTGFGIGAIAGEPTGLTLGFGLNDRNKVQVHLSWSLANDRARASADYLFTITTLTAPDVAAPFPVYVGFGGVVGSQRWWYDGDTPVLGARVPVGIAMLPPSVPIEIFAELAPVLYLLPGTGIGLEGGIGVRYWF